MKGLRWVENLAKKLLIPKYNTKYISQKFMIRFNQVLDGPFKGLNYHQVSVGSRLYPKILGTYEKELHSLIQEIILTNYQLVLNIGAGEGYYVVGLATKMPHTIFKAFETETQGQEQIKALAESNHVSSKIEIYDECDLQKLCQSLRPTSLVLMDIEGAEQFLLDPENCQKLLDCNILVEVHEHLVPGIQRLLHQRFNKTHRIKEIQSQERNQTDFKQNLNLTWDQRIVNSITLGKFYRKIISRLTSEYRKSPVKWFFIETKTD